MTHTYQREETYDDLERVKSTADFQNLHPTEARCGDALRLDTGSQAGMEAGMGRAGQEGSYSGRRDGTGLGAPYRRWYIDVL